MSYNPTFTLKNPLITYVACQKACKNDPGKEEKGVKNRPTLIDVRDLLQEKKLEEAGKGCWEWRQYAK